MFDGPNDSVIEQLLETDPVVPIVTAVHYWTADMVGTDTELGPMLMVAFPLDLINVFSLAVQMTYLSYLDDITVDADDAEGLVIRQNTLALFHAILWRLNKMVTDPVEGPQISKMLTELSEQSAEGDAEDDDD